MSRSAAAGLAALLLLVVAAAPARADPTLAPGPELTRVTLPANLRSDIELMDVASSDAGWVAVGDRRGETPGPAALFSPDGLSWSAASIVGEVEGTDVLATPPEGSAVWVASSGPLTVVAGCTGEASVCPSQLWRLEPDGALMPVRLGGIEAGEVAEISALALAPDGALLVVGDVAQGLDGPEESALWWSGTAGAAEIASP